MRSLVLTLAALLLMPHFAQAEKIGNGGGAWVCRETDRTIRWAKLVDLFEAPDQFGVMLTVYSGSPKDIVEQVKARLLRINPQFSHALVPYFMHVNDLQPYPPEVTYTDNVLEVIDDSRYDVMPSHARCAGGSLAYEQVVNFKEDGLILVASEVFNALPNNEKAAMVFHEAIYAYRRDTFGESDSVMTRRMVGLLFSNLTDAELKSRLSIYEPNAQL